MCQALVEKKACRIHRLDCRIQSQYRDSMPLFVTERAAYIIRPRSIHTGTYMRVSKIVQTTRNSLYLKTTTSAKKLGVYSRTVNMNSCLLAFFSRLIKYCDIFAALNFD